MDNKIIFWLKIIGWALLIHIILIALSFIEVFVYSLLFNPGQEEQVYEAHAQLSAPYISIIFGMPVFYFVAMFLAKKISLKSMQIAFGLPLIYILFDLTMLIPYEVDWEKHIWVFLISFGTKILCSYFGAKRGSKQS